MVGPDKALRSVRPQEVITRPGFPRWRPGRFWEDDAVDLSNEIEHLRPDTIVNLRKLAVWLSGEAKLVIDPRVRLSSEIVAMRFAEEAEWLDFQQQCEKFDRRGFLAHRQSRD